MTSMPEYKIPRMTDSRKAEIISMSVVSILVVGLIIAFIVGGPTGAGIYMFLMIISIMGVALFAMLYVGLRTLLAEHFENRRRR